MIIVFKISWNQRLQTNFHGIKYIKFDIYMCVCVCVCVFFLNLSATSCMWHKINL